MPLSPEDHPWGKASQAIELDPTVRNLVSFDPLVLNTPDGPVPNVLMSVATPSGVMSVFVSKQGLEEITRQGRDILKMWKDQESGLTIASPADMKNTIQAMQGLNGKIRP